MATKKTTNSTTTTAKKIEIPKNIRECTFWKRVPYLKNNPFGWNGFAYV